MSLLNLPLPFDSLTPDSFEQLSNGRLKDAAKRLDDLKSPTNRTYATLLKPLDELTAQLTDLFSVGEHLEATLGTQAWRQTMSKLRPKLTAFLTEIPLCEALYQNLKPYTLLGKLSPIGAAPSRFNPRVLRPKGANLAPNDKATFAKLAVELSKSPQLLPQTLWMRPMFSNLASMKLNPMAYLMPLCRGDGSVLGREGHGLVIAGDPVSVTKVLRFAESSKLRERVWRAYHQRGADTRLTIVPD